MHNRQDNAVAEYKQMNMTRTHFRLSKRKLLGHNMWVMWKGRFSKPTADLVQRYGESVSYDWRLFCQDIAGSIAHARAQLKAGLLTQEEFNTIEAGLQDILKDIFLAITVI